MILPPKPDTTPDLKIVRDHLHDSLARFERRLLAYGTMQRGKRVIVYANAAGETIREGF